MNTHKLKHFAALTGLSLILIFKFQNCAPPSGATPGGAGASASQSVGSNGALPVSVIDDVKANSYVSFTYSEAEFQSTADSVTLAGKCSMDQEGAVLGWKVVADGSSQVFASGMATCHEGIFDVSLDQVSQMACNQIYHISAKLGVVQGGQETIKRLCP